MNSVRIIFFSPTHTSAKVIDAIAEGIECNPVISDITYEIPSGKTIVEEDLTIVAAPVYGGRIPPVALQRIQSFHSAGKKVVPVVVYGNRHYDDALLELTNTLKENGFLPIAAGAFIGEHSYSRPEYPVAINRPDEKDLLTAKQFGEKIKQLLYSQKETISESLFLPIPGNQPYKEYNSSPGAPLTNEELCTQCEYCLEICPVQAISIPEDEMFSDPILCIHCCACVKFCPEQARTFETPFSKYLYENFSIRREPEFFFQSPDEFSL